MVKISSYREECIGGALSLVAEQYTSDDRAIRYIEDIVADPTKLDLTVEVTNHNFSEDTCQIRIQWISNQLDICVKAKNIPLIKSNEMLDQALLNNQPVSENGLGGVDAKDLAFYDEMV